MEAQRSEIDRDTFVKLQSSFYARYHEWGKDIDISTLTEEQFKGRIQFEQERRAFLISQKETQL